MKISNVVDVLKTVANMKRAMTTTPFSKRIQDQINAGTIVATPIRSGPFGLSNGEMLLELTDKGHERLKK